MPEKPRLLILEDDPIIAELFDTLFSFEGYDTTVAGTVVDGIGELEAEPPHAVVLDLMMPNASGLDFCRYLRTESQSPNIPIVVVSAKNQQDDIDAAVDVGADVYLTKPVSNRVLVETVQKLLDHPPSSSAPASQHNILDIRVRRAVVQIKLYLAEMRRAKEHFEAATDELGSSKTSSPTRKQELLRQATDDFRRLIRGNETAAWEIMVDTLHRLELRERAIARQSCHRPKGSEGWSQASSRSHFVEEDCKHWAASNPAQILGEYELALSTGDTVLAYLLERYGDPALQAFGAWHELQDFQQAVFEANPPDGETLDQLERYYAVLNPLRAQLSKMRPPEGVVLVQPTRDESSNEQPSSPTDDALARPEAGNGHLRLLGRSNGNGHHRSPIEAPTRDTAPMAAYQPAARLTRRTI